MAKRVGICPVCETKQRVRSFNGALRIVAHPGAEAHICCDGTDGKPMPTTEQMRRRAKRMALIEPFRPYAAVALDAWLEDRHYPALDIDILCRVAVFEYCVYYRVAEWRERKGRVNVRLEQRQNSNYFDAYCMFCGAILYQRIRSVAWGPPYAQCEALSRTGHLVTCSLSQLAFSLVPADPKAKRIPAELTPEALDPSSGPDDGSC